MWYHPPPHYLPLPHKMNLLLKPINFPILDFDMSGIMEYSFVTGFFHLSMLSRCIPVIAYIHTLFLLMSK